MNLMCTTCGRDWLSPDYQGYCQCGGDVWIDTSPVRRVQTSKVCDACARRGKHPAHEGYCECGADAWTTKVPGPRIDMDLVCDICRRKGKNPDLGGFCECGATEWITGPLTPRVHNSLICDGCHRRGKNPEHFGRCECGANAWTDRTPQPRFDTTLVCAVCRRRGKDIAYFGSCECGSNAWIDPTPDPDLPPSQWCSRCGCPGLCPEESGRCECGARAWISEPPAPRAEPLPAAPHRAPEPLDDPERGTVLDGNDVAPMIVDDYPGAKINELLGGIYRGAMVLVVGAAGAGKSTFSAELAAVAATCLDSKIYWLDRDQKHPDLVRGCFATLGTEDSFRRVKLVQPPKMMPRGWGIADALALVPDDAAILVLDSLETWGANDTIRLAVLQHVKEHRARLKLVIAGTNAEGGIAGVGALERADDATVYVEIKDGRHTIRRGKSRWPPCESALARARASGAPEWDSAQGSPTGMTPSAAQEPDFSLEAIERAATWTVREIEAYRGRLRAQGVPRDTLLGWDRAVAEHKTGMQRVLAAPRPHQSTGTLPERTMAAYAAVLRCWPSTWEHGVRVSEILKAIERDGLEQLADALRGLAGTREGVPSARDMGNALKWVRDVSVDGMTLTRTLDRNGIALWRVVRAP